ncbi:MAG: hypothetical protein IOC39_07500 [Burkholderia sp.]|jgi:hypothetical protein|uniref:hypothetical protein n=2 Tax=Burkholderiaceae TaxID=119060 RepID=UPI001589A41A|nr:MULTISPECIES: hypothetical protein [Burkholderia]MBY8609201.1 hypothetical protein [Burkholderia arboris]MCA3781748.1 hypothetical protein [Burkholderia sp.]MCA3785970.1 hypothetical protein [Burkholderia sp.]MCA3791448.1 hypothetical protein [Burkholderia sp.]MCA3803708.1 hypothetical protein [Burkholderia sp.]
MSFIFLTGQSQTLLNTNWQSTRREVILKRTLIMFALVALSTTAFAQYQGAYYQWRDGSDVKCAANAPNAAWKLISGPYFDGECSQPLPKRSDLPAPPAAPASGGTAK